METNIFSLHRPEPAQTRHGLTALEVTRLIDRDNLGPWQYVITVGELRTNETIIHPVTIRRIAELEAQALLESRAIDTPQRPPFEIDAYFADDGTPVIHIDTEALAEDATGPICRIYLNDGDALWENPPLRAPEELRDRLPVKAYHPASERLGEAWDRFKSLQTSSYEDETPGLIRTDTEFSIAGTTFPAHTDIREIRAYFENIYGISARELDFAERFGEDWYHPVHENAEEDPAEIAAYLLAETVGDLPDFPAPRPNRDLPAIVQIGGAEPNGANVNPDRAAWIVDVDCLEDGGCTDCPVCGTELPEEFFFGSDDNPQACTWCGFTEEFTGEDLVEFVRTAIRKADAAGKIAK